ncbi:MAG: hypothetical protein DWH91_05895 [Planctomycetota bacterium]|nr:MAG: hypothetical protein DWH91_05895 [Planctomycetota bacterium]
MDRGRGKFFPCDTVRLTSQARGGGPLAEERGLENSVTHYPEARPARGRAQALADKEAEIRYLAVPSEGDPAP